MGGYLHFILVATAASLWQVRLLLLKEVAARIAPVILRRLQIAHVLCLGWMGYALLSRGDKSVVDSRRLLDLLACDAPMGEPEAVIRPRAGVCSWAI